jgi:phosphoglucomutase/phosphomannomutase
MWEGELATETFDGTALRGALAELRDRWDPWLQAEAWVRALADRQGCDAALLGLRRTDASGTWGVAASWAGTAGEAADSGWVSRLRAANLAALAARAIPMWLDADEQLDPALASLCARGGATNDAGGLSEVGSGRALALPLLVGDEPRPENVTGVLVCERSAGRAPFDAREACQLAVAAGQLARLLALSDAALGMEAALDDALGRTSAPGGESGALARHAARAVTIAAAWLPADPEAAAAAFGVGLELVRRPGEGDPMHGVAAEDRALLERARGGLASVPVGRAHQEAAWRGLAAWLAEPSHAADRAQLAWLIEKQRFPALLDAFYRTLPFGTGGRRGAVGIGPNRFNPSMLVSSIQGHVAYLREAYPGEALSVVIASDVRCYTDLRGVYARDLPNPLLGLTSRALAERAAETYAANGVRVFLPRPGVYLSTPELSYTIRALGASAGLNVSASHNHPDDNGGKVYGRHGGQEVPPQDQRMSAIVERVAYLARLPLSDAQRAGLVTWIPRAVREAYLGECLAQSLAPQARSARVVFTPLHGVADGNAGEVLRRAGFEVHLVPEQSTLDGAFPAVPFRAPNPEVPESMQAGVVLAERIGADVVIACDPDGDRLGVYARDAAGMYVFLTGNEIAALLTEYKLARLAAEGRMPARPLVLKTEVTTELLARICERYGATLIGELLVGFKHHADVLDQIERTGRYGDLEATLADFVIGVEESHGILVTPQVRDKDAAGAALLIAELASVLRDEGRTLLDARDDLYLTYGYHAEILRSMVMTGAEGLEQMQRIQRSLRESAPAALAGWPVKRTVDHQDPAGPLGPIVSDTDRERRNTLVVYLQNGARVIVRPSGTEPKNKTYVEVPGAPLGAKADRAALASQRAELDVTAHAVADAFALHMLGILGVHLPAYALRISGLVPLDGRVKLVEDVMPELEARAAAVVSGSETETEAGAWLDGALADALGSDGRSLARTAFEEYVTTESARADAPERRAQLDAMRRIFG